MRTVQRTSDGVLHPRDVVRHPGAVVVLPLLDDGRVCLIRNFRVAVSQTLIELPAGTLEPGHTPAEMAERELIEETGYRAAKIEPLSAFYLSPGILDERMHLFLATGLIAGDSAREAGEEIENLLVPFDEAIAMANDTSYGLAGTVWTKDLAKALQATQRIEAGFVQVNQNLVVQANLSYGGIKDSGYGKEASLEAMVEHFTRKKTVIVNMT